MSDRYQGALPANSGRLPVYNPARASMPTSVGYSSLYAGDMHVVPSASHRHPITPRGYYASTHNAAPPTTTRTYANAQDSRAASSRARDGSKTRRSTLESASRRPVIITTTTQLDKPHTSSSHTLTGRSQSPAKDSYRTSDSQVFAQPASSIRSRRLAKPYHKHTASYGEDLGRHRERGYSRLRPRDPEPYRSSRPATTYPSDSRHSKAFVEYGVDGYQYTNAGELVKYDLDLTKPSHSSRRYDSLDARHHRPHVSYDVGQRNSLNVNASHDLSRSPSRQAEGRRPPPSSWGLDKMNRGNETRNMLPAAPVAPTLASSGRQSETSTSAGNKWSRPLSLHQDGPLRSSHHDDYYRSVEDERTMRDLRDRDARDHERRYEAPRYLDEDVASRGFGIRTDPPGTSADTRERRRDTRLEDAAYELEKTNESRHRKSQPAEERVSDLWADPRKGNRDGQDTQGRSQIRESLATSLGAAAAAVGLQSSSGKGKEGQYQESTGPRRRRSPPEEQGPQTDDSRSQNPHHVSDRFRDLSPKKAQESILKRKEVARGKEAHELASERGPLLLREREPAREQHVSPHGDSLRERETTRQREGALEIARDTSQPDRQTNAYSRRLNGENARLSGSDDEETRKPSRRKRTPAAFNPNDALDLKQLQEQLATMEVADQRRERQPERPSGMERPRPRSRSPSQEKTSLGSRQVLSRDEPRDEARGREILASAAEGKQVRLVSPPKDDSEDKPLKGILKPPKVSFPEDANPVREGVAPHKEDKKLMEVPSNARWTKISRKVVNPEALTIGRERFEAREDFVIVLRVLSKEEIQAYAAATQVLRERRRNRHDEVRDRDGDRDKEQHRDSDGDRTSDDVDEQNADRHHRHRRRNSDGDDARGRECEREHEHERVED